MVMLSYCHCGQLSITNVSPTHASSACCMPHIEWGRGKGCYTVQPWSPW